MSLHCVQRLPLAVDQPATTSGWSSSNPAVKRILREAREIAEATPTPDFDAKPLDGNLFEWHFTIRGPPGTAFEGGRYHGRITLPPEYPFKPPSIALLNASGRFSVGTKICLTVSAHHPEHWQPAWGIRTIITALMAFFSSKVRGIRLKPASAPPGLAFGRTRPHSAASHVPLPRAGGRSSRWTRLSR